MSVLVTLKVQGDTGQFRRWISSGDERLDRVSADARSRGCLHHRFGVGDGFVIVWDEWESADAFERFFRENPDMPSVMRDAGALGEPEITFTEAIETPDQF